MKPEYLNKIIVNRLVYRLDQMTRVLFTPLVLNDSLVIIVSVYAMSQKHTIFAIYSTKVDQF